MFPFDNVGLEASPPQYPQLEAPYCPVEADPFLPWLHDYFPNPDGTHIDFVAQNKRRCKSGKNHRTNLDRLIPQVTLFQPVTVQRLHHPHEATTLAPQLWPWTTTTPTRPHHNNENDNDNENDNGGEGNEESTTHFYDEDPSPRYRLAPREEASPDGLETRFICRFHGLDTTNLNTHTTTETETDTATTTTTLLQSEEEHTTKTSTNDQPRPGHQHHRQRRVILGETLSVYPFNYEFINFRKIGATSLLTPKGKDQERIYLSTLLFRCPVPTAIQHYLAQPPPAATTNSNSTPTEEEEQQYYPAPQLSDGSPLLHIDLIPIRTSARYGIQDLYLDPADAGPKADWSQSSPHLLWKNFNGTGTVEELGFHPQQRWGSHQVLPRIEASGRWTNLPLCRLQHTTPTTQTQQHKNDQQQQEPPQPQQSNNNSPQHNNDSQNNNSAPSQQQNSNNQPRQQGQNKKHTLIACTWASATFKTRGQHKVRSITDNAERLREWIIFHLMVGFDHIYVYDNSGAFHNGTTTTGSSSAAHDEDDESLQPTVDEFAYTQRVTRIDWPATVCNNDNMNDSPGERSSQYAAESSCRTRYGPYSDWTTFFDTDEYFVPMGRYTNMKDVLHHHHHRNTKNNKEGTVNNILAFGSSRGKIRYDTSR